MNDPFEWTLTELLPEIQAARARLRALEALADGIYLEIIGEYDRVSPQEAVYLEHMRKMYDKYQHDAAALDFVVSQLNHWLHWFDDPRKQTTTRQLRHLVSTGEIEI